jgi:putative membrane protein
MGDFPEERCTRLRILSPKAHVAVTWRLEKQRRSFLLALGGLVLAPGGASARSAPMVDFRTADLVGGEFAMRTSRLALGRSGNPDVINFANAEIAEQVQIATSLGAAPGTAPLRPDHAALFARLEAVPPGPAFNAMYVKGQIAGHRELLALNTSYLRTGTDPQQQSVASMSSRSFSSTSQS